MAGWTDGWIENVRVYVYVNVCVRVRVCACACHHVNPKAIKHGYLPTCYNCNLKHVHFLFVCSILAIGINIFVYGMTYGDH